MHIMFPYYLKTLVCGEQVGDTRTNHCKKETELLKLLAWIPFRFILRDIHFDSRKRKASSVSIFATSSLVVYCKCRYQFSSSFIWKTSLRCAYQESSIDFFSIFFRKEKAYLMQVTPSCYEKTEYTAGRDLKQVLNETTLLNVYRHSLAYMISHTKHVFCNHLPLFKRPSPWV